VELGTGRPARGHARLDSAVRQGVPTRMVVVPRRSMLQLLPGGPLIAACATGPARAGRGAGVGPAAPASAMRRPPLPWHARASAPQPPSCCGSRSQRGADSRCRAGAATVQAPALAGSPTRCHRLRVFAVRAPGLCRHEGGMCTQEYYKIRDSDSY
jgi:hypothetical protein